MNRKQKILQHINKEGIGVEIGPSHNPIASRKNGYHVDIIDHLDREQLIEKYHNHGVQLRNIEEVDYVWKGESYAELTGKKLYYDWIIASHVIEHTPDFIRFINDCEEILKEDGVLSLVIPDKRYCFDHFRFPTNLASVVDHHLQKNVFHTPGTVAEYYLNVVSQGGEISWESASKGKYRNIHNSDKAVQSMNQVIREKQFIDVHAWCFTPYSFRLLIHDLRTLGFVTLREISSFYTKGGEFFITLGKQGSGLTTPRVELLEMINKEMAGEIKGKSSFPAIATLRKLVRFIRKN